MCTPFMTDIEFHHNIMLLNLSKKELDSLYHDYKKLNLNSKKDCEKFRFRILTMRNRTDKPNRGHMHENH